MTLFENADVLFSNLLGLFVLWRRLESRLSRLEGRFDQFCSDQKNHRKEVSTNG